MLLASLCGGSIAVADFCSVFGVYDTSRHASSSLCLLAFLLRAMYPAGISCSRF